MLDYIQIVSLKKVSSEYVQYPRSFRSLKKWQQKNILRIAHNNHLRERKWLINAWVPAEHISEGQNS